MQDTNRIDEVETFEFKWGLVKIGLDHLHVFLTLAVTTRDFHRRTKVNGPYFRPAPRRMIGKTPIPTTRVQDPLTAKEFWRVGLHIIQKTLIPLLVHLGKSVPFESKAQCCFNLTQLALLYSTVV